MILRARVVIDNRAANVVVGDLALKQLAYWLSEPRQRMPHAKSLREVGVDPGTKRHIVPHNRSMSLSLGTYCR
ncbi:hypothetical protein GGR58DRAFT_457322 [Xylaria digitata]|nr:hypothetical protein GGR58DRAFT_457322 [Xylaria digitata]